MYMKMNTYNKMFIIFSCSVSLQREEYSFFFILYFNVYAILQPISTQTYYINVIVTLYKKKIDYHISKV